uniref:Uncharacterized protein n=2 Tax=Haematobia irritans TaxID=7368 RepID=A0A1L8E8V6_HAEIR
MQHRSSLHFIICCCLVIIHLFSRKDQALLLRRNTFFLFHTFLYAINFVSGLNIDFYFLSSKSLNFDQHVYKIRISKSK